MNYELEFFPVLSIAEVRQLPTLDVYMPFLTAFVRRHWQADRKSADEIVTFLHSCCRGCRYDDLSPGKRALFCMICSRYKRWAEEAQP